MDNDEKYGSEDSKWVDEEDEFKDFLLFILKLYFRKEVGLLEYDFTKKTKIIKFELEK